MKGQRLIGASSLVALALAASLPAAAQGITQEQADAILKELRAIRELLEKGVRPAVQPPVAALAPQPVKLPALNAPALGDPAAPLTLAAFSDSDCPYCRQFQMNSFEAIRKTYVDTGKLRFVSLELPLDMHPNAFRAALAARCAAEQGKYWELRSQLLSNAGRLQPQNLAGYAQAVGLDPNKLQTCLDARRPEPAVRADMALAAAAGISGTPTFILGRTQADGLEGQMIVGARSFEFFDSRIRELLAEKPGR